MTVRSEGPIIPADGKVSMVFSGLPLNDANTQTTNLDFAWIPDNVESDYSFIVENHSKHDNTNTDNDKDLYTVDVTIRSEGPITPADGNIGMVFSGLSLTDVNMQITRSNHSQHHTSTVIELDLHTVDVTIQSGGPIIPTDGNISMVFSDRSLTDVSTQITSSSLFQNSDIERDLLPADDIEQVTGNKGVLLLAHVPKGAAKIVELTLELFDHNYNLYAQKINHQEDGLFTRVILMKDKIIIHNNTFKIKGTSNVAIATIASADQVCNQYMVHARKGDSFICALGDGHHGVRIPIIRNEHLANFINTLNSIKVKIGMYTIVTGLKSDWLQYANHNTIYQELSLAPDKKTIIPTIESFLNEKWFKSWDDLAGHAQTKYWLPRPDSFLASKFLKMPRKHLGYNIQFFSGHGWWRKHLMTAKLSKSDKCRLCLEDQAVETPIHIFSECPAMAGFRMVLFNDTYPSQHTGQQSLSDH